MRKFRIVDVLLILFVSYLAIARFKDGMILPGALFAGLAVVYLVTLLVRIKNEREQSDHK